MSLKLFTVALLSGAVVAFAPAASAQVEASPMTEESRPPPSKPAPEPYGPRREPTLFGVGVAATVVGGVAVPVGGMLVLANILNGVEDGLACIGQIGQVGYECRSSSDATGAIGAALIVSGIVLVAVGIPMIVVGGKRLKKDAAFDPLIVRF